MLPPVPMHVIATMHSAFPTKFGIPRQSGLVSELQSTIVFEPEYRNPDALRGIEGFSHLWLVWSFSKAVRKTWSPTVRPPRLGGNTRMGVFATRSPFRPNAIGLSSVKLKGIEEPAHLGTVLHVSGLNLLDGTPIFDIKPYLPYTDAHPDATRRLYAELHRLPSGGHLPAGPAGTSPTRPPPCPHRACWPRSPARPTRTTRSGSMAWLLGPGSEIQSL